MDWMDWTDPASANRMDWMVLNPVSQNAPPSAPSMALRRLKMASRVGKGCSATLHLEDEEWQDALYQCQSLNLSNYRNGLPPASKKTLRFDRQQYEIGKHHVN